MGIVQDVANYKLKMRHLKLLKKSVRHWNLYRKLSKEKVIDLREVDLAFEELSNANLYKVNLSYSNLVGIDLEGAVLTKANFYFVNLSGAYLSNAEGAFANFSNANLSVANCSNANLYHANFSHAKLNGCKFCHTCLIGVNLTNSCWPLNESVEEAEIDSGLIRQLLFKAFMPTQNSDIKLDADIKKLFKLKSFLNVIDKYEEKE